MLVTASIVAVAACSGDDDDAASSAAEPSATAETTASAAPTTVSESTTPATTQPVATTEAPVETTSPSSTAPAVASTTPDTTGAPQSEAELAQSALFTAADFSADWTEEPYDATSDPDNDALLAQIAECSGLDVNLIGSDGLLGDTKAKSSKFESPDETMSVEQTLGFAADLDTALAGIAEIGDPALAPCYETAISEAFTAPGAMPPGMEVGEVSMEQVDISGLASADEVVWYTVLVPLTYEEQNLDQHLELIFLRTGRVMTQLELLGTGAPFPDEALSATIELALSRARAIDDTGA